MNKQTIKHVVVYGGSFNPPTYAHKYLVGLVSSMFKNVKVIVVPVNDVYQKPNKALARHRFNMTNLLLSNMPCVVSTYEIKQSTPCYTIDMVNMIRKQYPQAIVHLLLGSDNLAQIDTWKSAEQLLQTTNLLVVNRNVDIEDKLQKNALLSKYQHNITIIGDDIPNAIRNISSTKVRDLLQNDNDATLDAELQRYTSQDVIKYIYEEGLYNECL